VSGNLLDRELTTGAASLERGTTKGSRRAGTHGRTAAGSHGSALAPHGHRKGERDGVRVVAPRPHRGSPASRSLTTCLRTSSPPATSSPATSSLNDRHDEGAS
jgi:hypothetical protein